MDVSCVGERKKTVYENGCKLNLMVFGGGCRILCCYKYVKVVLTCVCGFLYIIGSVSLVVVCFLRSALECHSARVWYR